MKRGHSSRWRTPKHGKNGRPGTGRSGGDGQMDKIGGILLTVVMVGGIGISIWFGWAVRTGLKELAEETRVRQEFTTRHEKLIGEQQTLLKKERIEAVAATVGLFPARREQLQRP